MEKLCVLFLVSLIHGVIATAARTQNESEAWGYVEVRPKAHMFWWLYRSPYRVEISSKPWPIILWLQGGPGASGVGLGNFEEIGPLDVNLKPRNSTWLRMADLLFVDNPVGTGFSFVEESNLFVKTDEEAATDLTTLLKEIFNRNESLQQSPLHIVAESYGGKFAVTLGLSALKAIGAGKLKAKLGGVILGDTWISPEDFVVQRSAEDPSILVATYKGEHNHLHLSKLQFSLGSSQHSSSIAGPVPTANPATTVTLDLMKPGMLQENAAGECCRRMLKRQ